MELSYKETLLISVALHARIKALEADRDRYADLMESPAASGLLREMKRSAETRIAEYKAIADRIDNELNP